MYDQCFTNQLFAGVFHILLILIPFVKTRYLVFRDFFFVKMFLLKCINNKSSNQLKNMWLNIVYVKTGELLLFIFIHSKLSSLWQCLREFIHFLFHADRGLLVKVCSVFSALSEPRQENTYSQLHSFLTL